MSATLEPGKLDKHKSTVFKHEYTILIGYLRDSAKNCGDALGISKNAAGTSRDILRLHIEYIEPNPLINLSPESNEPGKLN